MSHKLFFVSQTNPNDTTGGGGCICSPERQPDCQPPYVIFPGNDMENISSPHVVACQACLEAGAEACSGEILAAGEVAAPVVIDAESWDDPDVWWPTRKEHGMRRTASVCSQNSGDVTPKILSVDER